MNYLCEKLKALLSHIVLKVENIPAYSLPSTYAPISASEGREAAKALFESG